MNAWKIGLIVVFVGASTLAWTEPTVAKLIKIEEVKPGLPEDAPYGQTIHEIRIVGNKYTRESVIRAAFKSKVGHIYTEENAR